MTLDNAKRTLRAAMLAWRRGLDEEARRAAAQGLIATLRADLLAWYDRARRVLPWRALPGMQPDPWRVLESHAPIRGVRVSGGFVIRST